jgi:DNA-binding transcriptional LysR family regulator
VEVERLGALAGVCALSIDHPLAAKEMIRAEELRDETFISLAEIDGSRSRIESAFESSAVDRNILLTTPQSAVALALVTHGAGCAIIDEATARLADPARVVIRPFAPAVEFDVYMYHPANRLPSQVQERFVRSFRQWFKGRRWDAKPQGRARRT